MAVDTTPTKKPAVAAAPTAQVVKPVVAVHRINGTILPGTMFRPTSAAQLAELEKLNAVRDLNEAEAALFEKTDRTSDDEIA